MTWGWWKNTEAGGSTSTPWVSAHAQWWPRLTRSNLTKCFQFCFGCPYWKNASKIWSLDVTNDSQITRGPMFFCDDRGQLRHRLKLLLKCAGWNMFLGGYRSDLIVLLDVQNLQASAAPPIAEAGWCFLEACNYRRTGINRSWRWSEMVPFVYGVLVW